MTDQALEDRIRAMAGHMERSRDPDTARACWDTLKALIGQRRPEQVERMERERGLA